MPQSGTRTTLVRRPRSRSSDCSGAQPSRPQPSANPRLALAIILGSYLMVVLDLSVIITALPKIHQALHFSSAGLSWVQSAYALTFGGLLLLGARAGDILGRRRVFIAGIGLFSLTSLVGGLAQSAEWLLAARAVQGVAAAIAAPSTLALLTSSFPEGPERTRAVAAYAAVAGGGSSVGLVLGGMLTQWISWRWGLFVNVPVGLVLMSLAPRYLNETDRHPGRFDLTGAATSTIGMTALVYGFVRAASNGWGDAVTVVSFATAVVLMAAFVVVERRAEQPITPLRLFASRQRSGAYLARLLVVGGMLSMFFFVTQYLQGARNFTALEAGLGFLPMTLVLFAMVRVVPRLVARVGDTPLLAGGLLVALAGMAWMSQISIDSSYFPQIAIPLALLGFGMGMAFTPLTTAGIAGVAPSDAGAASGLINAAQQLGGSLGLSVLVTVFASATHSALAHRGPGVSGAGAARDALAHAVASSLAGSAVLLALALLTVVVTVLPARTRAAAVVAETA
jgi:EmrB/QacA subfamily drug resistance transporter